MVTVVVLGTVMRLTVTGDERKVTMAMVMMTDVVVISGE